MTEHPTEEVLLSMVEQGVPFDSATVGHLRSCAACESKVEDVRALLTALREAGMADVPDPIAGTLDQDYAEAIRRTLYPKARHTRRFALVATAAAACAILWLGLRWHSDDRDLGPDAPLRMGFLLADAQTDILRGAKERTVHFRFQLPKPSHLIILRVADDGIRILYPHPNPVLGTFGHDGPLPPGVELRIPPSPIVDYVALPGEESAEYWAFFVDRLPPPEERSAILAAASAVLPIDRDAARERLAAKWDPPAIIPAWR